MAREPQSNPQAEATARRNYAKGLATRERVLAAAAGVINVRGFAGASLQEIATAAGLSKNHILHHFTTKDGLGAALIESALNAVRSELSTPAQIYPDAGESLRFVLRRASELQQSGWPHLRLLGVLAGERQAFPPQFRGQVQQALMELHTYLRGLAKTLRRSGGLPQEQKARALAGMILTVLLGAGVLCGEDDALGGAGALEALQALIAPAEPLGA